MSKKFSGKKFKTAREMDAALETADLAEEFRKKGAVLKSPLRKINLDLPETVVDQIDGVASRIGISRQPLLKLWIHERLKTEI